MIALVQTGRILCYYIKMCESLFVGFVHIIAPYTDLWVLHMKCINAFTHFCRTGFITASNTKDEYGQLPVTDVNAKYFL